MITLDLQYKDYNGKPQVRQASFHISKSALLKYAMTATKSKMEFADYVKSIIESDDTSRVVQMFDDLIRLAYGIRSEDGSRFIQTPDVWEDFNSTPAYDALFMSLLTDTEASLAFVKGILPEGMDVEDPSIDKAIAVTPETLDKAEAAADAERDARIAELRKLLAE